MGKLGESGRGRGLVRIFKARASHVLGHAIQRFLRNGPQPLPAKISNLQHQICEINFTKSHSQHHVYTIPYTDQFRKHCKHSSVAVSVRAVKRTSICALWSCAAGLASRCWSKVRCSGSSARRLPRVAGSAAAPVAAYTSRSYSEDGARSASGSLGNIRGTKRAKRCRSDRQNYSHTRLLSHLLTAH